MDNKKQNLTPELKQIYDRVMNTQVPVKQGAPAPQTQATPATPAPTTATPQQTPPVATPSPASTTPGAPPQTQNSPQANTTNTSFLSSVPPRAVADNKSFVFTGKKVEPVQGNDDKKTNPQTPAPHAAGGKKISTPIIGALVAVLVVVWGVFWAKLFGLF